MTNSQPLPQPCLEQRVILVAEDEPTVLDFVRMALESAGYHVLSARDGLEAIEVARAFPGAIDAVLSDVRMPRLDGPGLVERLSRQRLGLRVIFMSGQTDGSPLFGAAFLPKPFSPSRL